MSKCGTRKSVIPHCARAWRTPGRGSGIASVSAGETDRCPSVGANTKEWAHGYRDHYGSTTPKAGFTTPDDESGDVFVHYSTIIWAPHSSWEGEVEYEVFEGPRVLP